MSEAELIGRRTMDRVGSRIALAVALGAVAAGCGGKGSEGALTYTGHSRAAKVVLAVVARGPGFTRSALSFRFTPAGEPLWQKVKRLSHLDASRSAQLAAFCTSDQLSADAGIGPGYLGNHSLTVSVFHDLPTPKRWVCGLRTAGAGGIERPPKAGKSLLAVTLTRR
jgi:hypothetical protein